MDDESMPTNSDAEPTFTIKETAQQLGVPVSTVRFYLRHGLVRHVKRDKNRYRAFTPAQVEWLKVLVYFRRAGFTVRDLKAYQSLCQRGSTTLSQRKAMITTKIHQVRHSLGELNQTLDFLEQREELLDEIMQGHTDTGEGAI